LQVIATDAQAEAEEQSRLLASEQDQHHAERETLLAQRTVLEQELGSAIEQLAAAGSAADQREAELQLASGRLVEALDTARRLAAELASGNEAQELPEEPAPADAVEEPEDDEPEPEAAVDEPAAEQPEAQTEAVDS